MSVRNDSRRAQRKIKESLMPDVGFESGYVSLTLDVATDLGFARWEDGKQVPIKHVDVKITNNGRTVTVPHKGYYLAVKAAPRHVRRRLARSVR